MFLLIATVVIGMDDRERDLKHNQANERLLISLYGAFVLLLVLFVLVPKVYRWFANSPTHRNGRSRVRAEGGVALQAYLMLLLDGSQAIPLAYLLG